MHRSLSSVLGLLFLTTSSWADNWPACAAPMPTASAPNKMCRLPGAPGRMSAGKCRCRRPAIHAHRRATTSSSRRGSMAASERALMRSHTVTDKSCAQKYTYTVPETSHTHKYTHTDSPSPTAPRSTPTLLPPASSHATLTTIKKRKGKKGRPAKKRQQRQLVLYKNLLKYTKVTRHRPSHTHTITHMVGRMAAAGNRHQRPEFRLVQHASRHPVGDRDELICRYRRSDRRRGRAQGLRSGHGSGTVALCGAGERSVCHARGLGRERLDRWYLRLPRPDDGGPPRWPRRRDRNAPALCPRARIRSAFGSGVLHAGHLYLSDADGFVECLEAATGKGVWKERLGGNLWGPLLLANDKLYVSNLEGSTFVLAARPRFELLGATRSASRPTPAAGHLAGGAISADVPALVLHYAATVAPAGKRHL